MPVFPPFTSVREFIQILQTQTWTYCASAEPIAPVVSIISSFFNADRYFEETYRCVINQTFQNFEWIIVDDGSTDPEAIALFQDLSQRHKRIKTLNHPVNQGPSAGRNRAIGEAIGKYLFFIDLDDLIDPTYIEKAVLFLETHPEFSFVNSYSVGFQAQEYWWNHGFDQPARFFEQNWVTGRLLYRKSDFDRLGGFDEDLRVYEDWERWLRAIVQGQQGWTIPEYLDCYRRLDSGLLARSCKEAVAAQTVVDAIKARYHSFSANSPRPVECKSQRFEQHRLGSTLAIANPLKSDPTTQRILCFFPHLEMGGADRFNLDLITQLTERGYTFTIATTLESDHPWHQHFYTQTPDIFHLPHYLDDQDWLAFARYIIQSRQIDLVFISNCYVAYYFIPLLQQEFPHLVWVDLTHTIDPGWRGIGYPRLSWQFSQFFDRQVVTSQWLASLYTSIQPWEPEKLQVCYTNINSDDWVCDHQQRQQLRSSLKISDDTPVLLFPARLVEQKRPLFLVDIIQALVRQVPDVGVFVVGQGELLAVMQAKVNQLNLATYFHFWSGVAPDAMSKFYGAADILLLPSAYEGIALTLYEAMAMQLPIVASEVGGQAELVAPGTGFLVPLGAGDGQEVQDYLRVLLPLLQKPQHRQKIGIQARQRVVEQFSLTTMVNQMETIFQAAIARRQTRPKPEVNLAMAEEMLLMTLEYLHQEQALSNLWQEKCWLERERDQLRQEKYQLEAERHELAWKKRAMESSKFWQLRIRWVKFKRWLRLTQEEEI